MKINTEAPSGYYDQKLKGGMDPGFVTTHVQRGGIQAKAIINTVKTFNANRFYKGYAQKLAKNREQTDQHLKAFYDHNNSQRDLAKENKKSAINKPITTAKKA